MKLLLFLLQVHAFAVGAGVTYDFSNGRFGDRLLSYLHAKWISFKYQIPLYYKPFIYSNKLRLHQLEKPIAEANFKKTVILTGNDPSIDATEDCLYIVPFFSEFSFEQPSNPIYFQVNWDNPDFGKLINNMLQPIEIPALPFIIPESSISIAIHVRKNEDALLSEVKYPVKNPNQYVDFYFLLKCPPLDYYIQQLKYVVDTIKHTNLYIFIFTDDNPVKIMQIFKNEFINCENVSWNCRNIATVGRDNLVIEDFYAMTKFDILIRPLSNFSFIAGKISNYAIEISPKDGHWESCNNRWNAIIDKIQISCKNNNHIQQNNLLSIAN